MSDFRWMSVGGCLVDGSGDLALANNQQSLADMINTRLKSALNGWKQYRIGADLDRLRGSTVTPELETKIQRQITAALTENFLPTGSFTVKTVPSKSQIDVFVYFSNSLIATAQVNL